MKKKKKIVILIIAMALLIIGIWIKRVIALNSDKRMINDVGSSQTITYGGIEYTISDVKVWDFKEFVYQHPCINWLSNDDVLAYADKGMNMYMLTYNIKLKVGSKEEVGSYVTIPESLRAYEENWVGCTSPFYEIPMNEEMYNNTDFNNAYDTEIECICPVRLLEEFFTEKQWKRFKEKDTGIKLIIAYKPEEYYVNLNDSQFMNRTDEAEEYFNAIAEDIRKLEEVEVSIPVAMEENVYDGQGVFRDLIDFNILSVERIDIDEYDETDIDFKSLFRNPQTGVYYRVKLKLSNLSDQKVIVSMGVTSLLCEYNDQFVAKCELEVFHNETGTGKTAEDLVLEPYESVEYNLGYATYYNEEDFNIFNNIWDEGKIYFAYNLTGMFIQSTNNKLVFFIDVSSRIKRD